MTENTNPFLTAYHTPFETIPFHLIKTEHFEPAIEEGMKVHNQEVDAIIHCPDAPLSTIPSWPWKNPVHYWIA